MSDDFYDVIIIGTGAGGSTLALRLAPGGKRILLLERGGFLPREKANWDSTEVFRNERYHTEENGGTKRARNFARSRATRPAGTPRYSRRDVSPARARF